VNTSHEYENDKSGFGVGDHWAIMGAGDKGDCEDFALTKMQALLDAGMAAKNLQLIIGKTETDQWHAYLSIQTNNRGTLVLDNRYPNLMNMNNIPYGHYSYQRAGKSWASFTTQLEAVTIEYMTCNAAAFADGDAVLVGFTDQDWMQPKVIGFKDNPNACGVELLDEWVAERFLWDAPTTTNFTPSAGTSRLVLVCVGSEDENKISTVNRVNLGGKRLTEIDQDYLGPRGSSPHIYYNAGWIGYLDEADIADMSGSVLTVTWTNGQPTDTSLLGYACFENVNQDTPITDYSIERENVFVDEISPGEFSAGGGDQALYFIINGFNFGFPDPVEQNFFTAPPGWTEIWEYGHTFTVGIGHRDDQVLGTLNPTVEQLFTSSAIIIGVSIKAL